MNALRYSEQAEQNLIGSILLRPELFDKLDSLNPDAFYVGIHAEIWRCISRMVAAGESIDVITVAESLPKVELNYLGDLAANATGANVQSYARIIKEKAIERSLIAAAHEIIASASSEAPVKEKIEVAQSAIMEIGAANEHKTPRIVSSIMADVVEDIETRWNGEKRAEAIGMPDLDRMVHLLVPGALNVVAARPSMGKTAFALNVAHKYASQGKTVLFCSQEMGDVSLVQRLLASVSRVPIPRLINAELHDDDFSQISYALSVLNDEKLVIDEQAALTLGDVRTKARQVKRKHGLDLLVIDYLQLMVGTSESRHEEIAEISRGLKKLAKDMQIPVIALSQLNRGLENRPDKRPQMADIRESGQIEQDADIILALYRDEVYNPDSPMKGMAEVICRKNRQGRLGTVHMTFIGDLCSFEPYAGDIPKPEVYKPMRRGMA